jgi:aspartyl protease
VNGGFARHILLYAKVNPAGNAYFSPMKQVVTLVVLAAVLCDWGRAMARGPVITIGPIISSDSASCVIPFKRIGNLILIRAKADTSDGYFVLDTGAPGLVLNITYFRGYPVTNSPEGGGITGSAGPTSQTSVDSLRIGPVSYLHVEADLINLGHIEKSKGVKIYGLLGMELFARFEMIIDYGAGVIYLRLIPKREPAGYRNAQLADTSVYSIIPIEIEEGKIIVYIYLQGKKLKFIIDSGAETNVLDSRLPGKVFQQVEITKRVVLGGSGSRKVEALSGVIKDVRIGGRNFASLPVLITNLESMCDSYNSICLNGMLGFDFLSLHKIGFNFVTHTMYIWK